MRACELQQCIGVHVLLVELLRSGRSKRCRRAECVASWHAFSYTRSCSAMSCERSANKLA